MQEQIIGKSIYHPGGEPLDFNQMVGRTSLYDEDGNPLNILSESQINDGYARVVSHGAVASTIRPDATLVIWVGTVEPTNGNNGDIYIDTDS